MRETISFIIPTLNAEKYIDKLIKRLLSQTIQIQEIILLDSESDDKTVEIANKYDKVRIVRIERKNFDHGGTRNIGFEEAVGDIVFVMSQDALPCDKYYVENMLSALKEPGVVMATARQVPYPDAPRIEKITRAYNYSDKTIIKDISMLDKLGVKTFFFSDVCSAYKKNVYFELGGYETPALICNDMVMASKALHAGYSTAYKADAKVFHSHKYTLKQQYKRNFDTAADMLINKDYFDNASDTKEGIKMVKYVLIKLIKGLHFITAFYYCIECAAKLFGNRSGKKYESMSKEKILKRTTNKSYWYRKGIID
ncbi:MAG: glycosyltransferase family 2 protein [Clostridia bacterium]|nr:glycosyltransferase family 2 protein [Clostridia bacterium]